MAGKPEAIRRITLAQDCWGICGSIKNLTHKHFDECAFFFDYNDGV